MNRTYIYIFPNSPLGCPTWCFEEDYCPVEYKQLGHYTVHKMCRGITDYDIDGIVKDLEESDEPS